MADPGDTGSTHALEYTFTLDAGFARSLTSSLTATLWLQNERLHQAVESGWSGRQREGLRPIAIALSMFGLLLALGGATFTHGLRSFFVAAASAFALLLWAFSNLTRLRGGLRTLARRLVERAARRGVAALVRGAPYSIRYRLKGRRLAMDVRSAQRSRSSEIDLEKIALVVATPAFLAAFGRPLAARPSRLLFLSANGSAAALRAAVLAAGPTNLELP